MSPARQAEWATTQALPLNLRAILQDHMLKNPKSVGQVRSAVDAYNLSQSLNDATPQEVNGLRAAAGALGGGGAGGGGAKPAMRDSALAAGMEKVTSTASGIPGATTGWVQGKKVLLPSAGMANRLAYQSGMNALGLDGGNVGDPAEAAKRSAAYVSREERRANDAARQKQRDAIELQRVENEGPLGVAKVNAGAKTAAAQQKTAATEQKTKQRRGHEEEALRFGMSKFLGSDYSRYQGQVNSIRGELYKEASRGNLRDTDAEGNEVMIRPDTPEFRVAVKRRAQEALGVPPGLTMDQYKATPRFHERFSQYGSMGSTESGAWKRPIIDKFLGQSPVAPAAPPAPTPSVPQFGAAPAASPSPTPPPAASPTPSPSPAATQQDNDYGSNVAHAGTAQPNTAPAAPVGNYVSKLQSLNPQSPQDAQRVIAAIKLLNEAGRTEDARTMLQAATTMGFNFGPR